MNLGNKVDAHNTCEQFAKKGRVNTSALPVFYFL